MMKTARLRAKVTPAATAAKRRVSVTLSRGKEGEDYAAHHGHDDGQEKGYALEVFHQGLGQPPPEESEEYEAYGHGEGVVVDLAGDVHPQLDAESAHHVGWAVHPAVVDDHAVEKGKDAGEGENHPVDGQLVDLVHVVFGLGQLEGRGEARLPWVKGQVFPVVGHESQEEGGQGNDGTSYGKAPVELEIVVGVEEVGQTSIGGGVIDGDEAEAHGKNREEYEGYGHGGRGLVGVLVLGGEPAIEDDQHGPCHVEGAEEGYDERRPQQGCVVMVEGGEQNLVLAPEASEYGDAS